MAHQMTTINRTKITSIVIASVLASGMTFMLGTQAFAHQLNTNLEFEYDDPTPNAGDVVVMTGTVTTSNTAAGPGVGNPAHGAVVVNDGQGKIQQGYLLGEPASACSPDLTWVDIRIPSTAPVNGVFTHDFDTTGLAGQTLVFRALYVTGGSHYAATTNTACLPLTVSAIPPADTCEGNVELKAYDTSANGASTVFGYKIVIKACVDLENLKVQGGSNAWSTATIETGYPTIGEATVKIPTKKNSVFTWTIPEMNEGDEGELSVLMTTTKPLACGQTVGLNGGWSVVYDTVDETGLKSTYTDPLTYTRVCLP